MSISKIVVNSSNGEEMHVAKQFGFIKFGRDKKVCHVVFDPKASRVSREHACLNWTATGVIFEDKSQEGSYIDGAKIKKDKMDLEVGVYNIRIGGIEVTLEIHQKDARKAANMETESEYTQITQSMEDENDFESFSRTSVRSESVSTVGPYKYKRDRKRKCDETTFEEDTQSGPIKRGPGVPTVSKMPDFEDELETGSRRGPFGRRSIDKTIFDDTEERVEPQRKRMNIIEEEEKMEEDDDIIEVNPRTENINAQQEAEIAEIVKESPVRRPTVVPQNVSREKIHTDRGPAPANETIKYVDLIYRQSDYQKNSTTHYEVNPNVKNFKRFVPKAKQSGHNTSASFRSFTSNVSIPLVNAKSILKNISQQ